MLIVKELIDKLNNLNPNLPVGLIIDDSTEESGTTIHFIEEVKEFTNESGYDFVVIKKFL